MSKRTRSVNWDEEEKQLFCSVLKDFSQIIEDKTLTTTTNKLKVKAWEEVHQKFNSLICRERDLNQLKIQWKGMKMLARKEFSNYKRESNKTGGGPRPATPGDSIVEVKDLLNPAELLIDHNIYDSDGPEQAKKIDIVLLSVDANEICTPPALQDTTNISVEEMDTDVDKQIHIHEFSKTMEDSVLATPLGSINARNKPARKLLQSKINKQNSTLKSQKGHEDYITEITRHSKDLKEKEHARRMEMAEEKHALEIEIVKENLRTAQLERDISVEKLKRLQ